MDAEVKVDTNNDQPKVDTNLAQNKVNQQLGKPIQPPAPVAPPAPEATETPEEINWKKVREQRAKEREAAKKDQEIRVAKEKEVEALKAALEAVVNRPQPQQQYQSYDAPEETEEQRIEKLVNVSIAKRDAAIEQQRKKHEMETYPSKLQNDYKDFNEVCTAENLDYLDYHYPEVTAPYAHIPDGYDKWAAVYKAVKKFVPNTNTKKDMQKATANMNKPQSMSSPAQTPQGTGENQSDWRAIEKRRADNYARMQKQMKSVSNG